MSVRFVLLCILGEGPTTPYGIERALRRDLAHVWRGRANQIYSELATLETEGFVRPEPIEPGSGRAERVYSLTPAGYAAFDAWLRRRPEPRADRRDLLMKIYCLQSVWTESALSRLQSDVQAARDPTGVAGHGRELSADLSTR